MKLLTYLNKSYWWIYLRKYALDVQFENVTSKKFMRSTERKP